ncbi:Uncharacterized protein BP5553_02911 [Venustampulla echinocandica]|uniref:GIY-YIG domain-containing protein n=1 Tax=Venustampulla echinocandica TaxID=2656787 RepID=A0A370TSR8_9HELO|nr:Uncharacterized protein BP5553_02911 [Venustampulla echinocandica]RDL38571.1 Uncharacterized protein BP5553_02911 [Venustampulla echinocandica]
MASIRGLPIQDYGCYAVTYPLLQLHKNQPQLFQKLVDLIANSLEDDYCLSLDSFPTSQHKETTRQREQRNIMIQEWQGDFERLGVDWPVREAMKINILDSLFYSIWNIHWRYPISTSATQASPVTNSVQLVGDKGSRQVFGNIQPAEILEYALSKIRELQAARYSKLLASRDDWVTLLSIYIQSSVWQLCQKPHISRQDLINIGGDLDCHRPAIYLHIIWHPDDDNEEFFLYVGQSIDLKTRLKDHMNPLNRNKHPSLHYHAWDARPGNLSAFVVLAYLDDIRANNSSIGTKDDLLKMNIIELWGTLIFQTLPKRELEKYLNPTTIIGRQHLNVFNPLWQGVSNLDDVFPNLSRKERFTTLLHGADDITRSYYYSLRDEFFKLKNSPNPTLRAYYNAVRELPLAALADASAKRAARVLEDLMYPARRFCLRITGLSLSRPFTYFVQAGGDITTQEINALVDLLDGHKKEDIINRPRRLLPWRFDIESVRPKKVA